MDNKLDIDKLVFRVVTTALVMLIFAHVGVCIIEDVDFKTFFIMFAVFVSMIPLGIIIYKKYKNTATYRNIISYIVLIVVGLFTMYSGNNDSYIIGIAVGVIFLIYSDFKLVLRMTIGYMLIVVAFVISWFVNGSLPEGNKIVVLNIAVPILFSLIYSITFVFSTWFRKKNNDMKINAMKEAADKSESLLNDLKVNASKVKDRVGECTEYINELDVATENSNLIFEKIADGIKSSENSIKEQKNMTVKIEEYIEDLQSDTKSATKDIDEFMVELSDSKEYMEKLLIKSINIMNMNKKLLDTIHRFSTNTINVKKITEGIADISDQTSLLSLNASIESARVGENGKGFILVSQEIRSLSDETANLTNNIEKILNIVEVGAKKAELLVNKIEHYIAKENETIKDTVDGFDKMKGKIENLRAGMNNVSGSSNYVLNYNSSIIKHIEQLSKETKEVTRYIEEALKLNELNKAKSNDSKNVINELGKEVEKLTLI